MKINKAVITHKTGFTKDKVKDLKVPALVFYEKHIMTENANLIDERVKQRDAQFEKEQTLQKLNESKTGKDRIRIINSVYSSGKDILFKDIMFEMFSNALLLDDSFVTENTLALKSYMDGRIEERGGYQLLLNAIESTGSETLKKIKALCEATAKKAANSKLTKEEENLSIFTMTSEEKNEFDYGKKDINIDELADLVKSKVLNVVQDEKKKTQMRQDFIDDLENEISEKDEGASPEEVEETVSKILTKSKKELPSLFEALMTNSYKELLENVASMQASHMDRRETVLGYDTETDEGDVDDDENEDFTEEDIEDSFSEDSVTEDDIDRSRARDEAEECACEGSVDMDEVMAEAITKYTVLELFNTLKLEVLGADKRKKLVQSLIS